MFIHQFIEYLHDNVWMQVYKSDRKNRNNTGSIRKVGCVWVCVTSAAWNRTKRHTEKFTIIYFVQ